MKTIFSQPQQQAHQELLNHAQFHFRESKREENHPILIRSNILLRAPSGVGKTHIVSEVANNLEIPVKRINASSWGILGSRYGKATFAQIFEFVKNNRRGIIFVDEIDKVSAGKSEWLNSLRLELHELLDHKIPSSIEISAAYPQPGDDDDFPIEHIGLEYKKYSAAEMRAYYEGRLKHDFLIVGAGAWHDLNQSTTQMGFFNGNQVNSEQVLSYDQLESMISPEILRRFNSEHIVMSPMMAEDYEDLIQRIAQSLPATIKSAFENRASALVPTAVEKALEFRLIEDVMQGICLEMFQNRNQAISTLNETILNK